MCLRSPNISLWPAEKLKFSECETKQELFLKGQMNSGINLVEFFNITDKAADCLTVRMEKVFGN